MVTLSGYQKCVRKLAEYEDCTIEEARKRLNNCMQSIRDVLLEGERICFKDYFTFQPVNRKERSYKDPNLNREVKIPAYKTVRVRVGNLLKNMLNSRN